MPKFVLCISIFLVCLSLHSTEDEPSELPPDDHAFWNLMRFNLGMKKYRLSNSTDDDTAQQSERQEIIKEIENPSDSVKKILEMMTALKAAEAMVAEGKALTRKYR